MTADLETLNDRYPRPASIAPAEWAARVQLAATYRIFVQLGWHEMIYNHISLRVPNEPGHFLLNPFGLHYSEVCASNLVKVDVRGNIVGDSAWPINPAGFTFHGAIHETLADAHCVMHVHTTPTMAVCCLEDGLSFTNFYAAQLHGKVAYHDFEGITVHLDEGRRILASAGANAGPLTSAPAPLGGRAPAAEPQGLQGFKPVLLLRNHGPVVIGFSLANAFSLMWVLQRACEVQVASQPLGRLRPIPTPVLEGCVRDSLNFNPSFGAGQDVFDAMQRLVDRVDPSYRG
jgi:ribulose-5-phosphate 4-epimerase/fuculose-1-phosphate aldolase